MRATLVIFVVVSTLLCVVPVLGSHKNSGNQGQGYRLPWLEGEVSRLNPGGYPPNTGGHGAGAVDFEFAEGEPVKAVADGKVMVRDDIYCAGWTVEIDHIITGQTTRRSRYLHLQTAQPDPTIAPSATVFQGQIIGFADNSGSEDNNTPPLYRDCSTATHLHFDLQEGGSSISWGAGGIADGTAISQRAAADFTTTANLEESNNAGAAMWDVGGRYQAQAFRTAYFAAGGWRYRGSTSRMEASWEVCPGTGSNRVIWSCPSQFGTMHFQTFRGMDGKWRSAMVNKYTGSDGPVYWVTRGFSAAFTAPYQTGKKQSWRTGAPSGEAYPISTPLLRQDFQKTGQQPHQVWYMLFSPSSCTVGIYYGGSQQFLGTGQRYCDGGDAAGQGYGSDGD